MLLKDHLYIILMSVNVVNVEVPGQQRPGRPGVGQLELVSPDDGVRGPGHRILHLHVRGDVPVHASADRDVLPRREPGGHLGAEHVAGEVEGPGLDQGQGGQGHGDVVALGIG